MAIVVDSSVAACWALPDEFSAVADLALELSANGGMVVPAIFAYELRNVLLVSERRGRIGPENLATGLEMIGAIPLRLDAEFREAELFSLARRNGLTIYDAAYLELALRVGLPIATLDRKLAAAAAAEGATVVAVAG